MARILVVDDDIALAALVERTLVKAHHTVALAINGAHALRLLHSEQFDLILTDLVMPEAEGMQLLRDLRKLPSAPKTIAMSGGGRGSATDYLELASVLGAAATIEKPFTPTDLLAIVERVLGLHPAQ